MGNVQRGVRSLTKEQTEINLADLDRAAEEWELVSHSFLSGGLDVL